MFRRISHRRGISAFAFLTLLMTHVWAADPAPASFKNLYLSLNGYVDAFANTILANWNGAKYPVVYGAQLTSANANMGVSLVIPGHYQGVLLEMDGLKALGVQAVYVSAGFPMFYPPYFKDRAQYQQFVDFYTQVARDVRSRGMKLIVQSTSLLKFGAMIRVNPSPVYQGLGWDQYQRGRVETIQTIIQIMQPDYLVVIEEPDTEALHTGQSQAGTVSGSTELLNRILSAVQEMGATGTRIGAGVGTYHSQFLDFINSYAHTAVDFIDMHIYNVNKEWLSRCFTIADTAAAAGKPISISQAWLAKMGDDELLSLPRADMSARDPFSFWAPLDTYFLQTLVNFSNYRKLAFFVPFFTQYFRAYLPYDASTQSLSPREINDQEVKEMTRSLMQGSFTDTALGYYRTVLSTPDSIPPAVPGSFSAISGSGSGMTLKWDASSDNVGTAGYNLYRDGVKIATTAYDYYQDSGLINGTAYSYMIQAFDAASNLSSPLAIQGITRDTTPPEAPAQVVAAAVTKQRIDVTWAPAQDNGKIAAYHIFRGTDRANLTQAGVRKDTIFQDYSVDPGSTRYYAIKAMDSAGNYSPMSLVVSATTPSQ